MEKMKKVKTQISQKIDELSSLMMSRMIQWGEMNLNYFSDTRAEKEKIMMTAMMID